MATWFETYDVVPDVGDVVFVVTPDGNIDVCEYVCERYEHLDVDNILCTYTYTSVSTRATEYRAEDIERWASREQMLSMLKEGGYL